MDLKLPKPTKNVELITSLSLAVISDFLSAVQMPGGSTITKVMEIWRQKRIESAQEILFDEVAKGNTELLYDPDYEGLIPNIFSYFECAQRGEFNHNLRVLARLLVGETNLQMANPGKIRRVARRLEAMSLEDLQLLVLLKETFDQKQQSPTYDGYHLFVNDHDVVKSLNRNYVAPETHTNTQLIDFVSRGLLFIGGNPATIGGHYYYKTESFEEIVAQATA